MDKFSIYEAWAPAASVWSPWVKPAPFAHLSMYTLVDSAPTEPAPELVGIPAANQGCALVVDLPGTAVLAAGLALAQRGYRPVSLLSSLPPAANAPAGSAFYGVACAVEVRAQLAQLAHGSAILSALTLPADAPPAFLIDADRQAPGKQVVPSMFDNRAVVYPSDFPSAKILRERGINRVLVLHPTTHAIDLDLIAALSPWTKAGIEVTACDSAGIAPPIAWPYTGFWGALRLRFDWLFSHRANAQGGFGRFVPEASAG